MFKFALPLLLLSAFASGRLMRYGSNKEWDVILFTQNWPVSECIQWKQDNPNGSCNLATSSQWTVHGMWPTKLGTKGPGFCNKNEKFDISEIESIVDQMSYRWLSVHGGNGADKSFWKHEWEKHGTCAMVLDSLDSEMKYFSQGLDWNSQYNMTSLLGQAGLTPGGSAQTIDTIYNGLQSALGTNPFVSCHKSSGQFYLIDVRICFDKSLSLVDCDGVERYEYEHPLTQDCPDDTPIYYPSPRDLDFSNDPDNYLQESS